MNLSLKDSTNTKNSLYIFISFLLLIATFEIYSSIESAMAKPKDSTKGSPENDSEKKEEKKIPIDESQFKPVLIGALLNKPEDFLGKKIKFRGKFSSFTTLALDYEGAMRKPKDYISICLFRADSKIPLSELKLAYPIKDAMDSPVIKDLEEGDLLEINGEVFSAALGEPWVDIVTIKNLQSKKDKDNVAENKKGTEKQKKSK